MENGKREDRVDQPVRYSLVVSLRTVEQGVDLYSPVAVEVELPVEEAILAT